MPSRARNGEREKVKAGRREKEEARDKEMCRKERKKYVPWA